MARQEKKSQNERLKRMIQGGASYRKVASKEDISGKRVWEIVNKRPTKKATSIKKKRKK